LILGLCEEHYVRGGGEDQAPVREVAPGARHGLRLDARAVAAGLAPVGEVRVTGESLRDAVERVKV
jgi:hypothetical protein